MPIASLMRYLFCERHFILQTNFASAHRLIAQKRLSQARLSTPIESIYTKLQSEKMDNKLESAPQSGPNMATSENVSSLDNPLMQARWAWC